jgi:hypothetical protein
LGALPREANAGVDGLPVSCYTSREDVLAALDGRVRCAAGVLIAAMLAIVVAMYRIARPHDAVLGDYPGADG